MPPSPAETDPSPTANRQAAARNLGWVALESAGVSLLSLTTLLVLARLIGPAGFGVAGLALAIVQVLTLVAEMPFHDALVQRRSLEPAHRDSALWTGTGLGAVLCALCWLAGPGLETLFAAPGLGAVLGWMGLCLPFAGANGVMTAVLRRDLRFRRVAARGLLARLAGAAAGLALALAGFGVWALVAQQVAMAAGATLALALKPPFQPHLAVSGRHLRELVSFALPAFTAGFLWQANLRLFVLAVGAILGPVAVGHLTVALRLVDTARQLLATALHQLALPLFARRQGDRAALTRGFRQATELTALTTLPPFAALLVLAPEVVALVLGPGWEPAVPLVRLLAVVAMAQLVRQFANTALTAVGAPQLLAWQNLAGFVVSLGAVVLLTPAGPVWATVAWALRFALVLPFGVLSVRHAAGIGIDDQLGPALGPLLAVGVMAALLSGAAVLLPTTWTPLERLLLLVPAGGLAYAAAAWLGCRSGCQRLIGFLMLARDLAHRRRDMPSQG